MSFSSLPNEILLWIGQCLTADRDISALVRTNKLLLALLNQFLYQNHVRRHHPGPRSALYWAARKGRLDTIKKLKRAGADVELKPVCRGHPICDAARHGHSEVVGFFLEHGFERVESWRGHAPYDIAAQEGHIEVMKLFIQRGVNTWHMDRGNITMLASAVAGGHTAAVEFLLQEVQQREAAGTLEQNVKTRILAQALRCASARPDDEHLARMLLAAGADVNHQELTAYAMPLALQSTNPLATAARCGLLSMAKLLLDAGADPNLGNGIQEWPLSDATQTNTYQWRVGKDGRRSAVLPPRRRETAGPQQPPGDINTKEEMLAMVRLLLDSGADPVRCGGYLAIANAIKYRHGELVELLRERGVHVRAAREDNQSTLDAALVEGDLNKACDLLLHPWQAPWRVQW